MNYKELAKEYLEELQREITGLRRELISESQNMADSMQRLEKKAPNGTLNSLGEIQGTGDLVDAAVNHGLRVDRLCIRIAELERQYNSFASMIQRAKE